MNAKTPDNALRALPSVDALLSSMGGAVLAARSRCPILPVAHNAGEFWPRRGFLKRPGTVQVVFGPLIASEGRSPQELNWMTETWIETTMTRIGRAARAAARPDDE